MNNDGALLALPSFEMTLFADSASSSAGSDEVAPYDVAHALRATIARDGSMSAKALFVAYEALNRALFNNALPPATLLWTAPGSPRAYADHIAVDEHGIRFRIRVSPSIRKYGPRFMLDVVMHEMVHAACNHLDQDNEPGYRGHGPKFAARCNAIGAKLGLPEVAPKGKRAGKPDCAQWPLNVRPAGYYGPTDPRDEKAPKNEDGTDREPTDREPTDRKPSRAKRYEAAMIEAIALIRAGDPEKAEAVLSAALAE